MSEPQRIAVVTGSRADFGLLVPVMRAIESRPDLELQVITAGAHHVGEQTWRDVAALFDIAAQVPMQQELDHGRPADAAATGRGVINMTEVLQNLSPNWVVVLGDRIEAFATAAAASISGAPLAHIHGGDRAEGIADESMRHAISKLAHLHLPATRASGERIERMGEPSERIEVVGSPAVDGLDEIDAVDDDMLPGARELEALVLFHPVGDADEVEYARATRVVEAVSSFKHGLCAPNRDPGHEGVRRALGEGVLPHMPRPMFLGLLKRLALSGGVLVGNSSAGLIEAAALGVRVVDIGERQGGRERGGNVVHSEGSSAAEIAQAIREARSLDVSGAAHPYGDGRAGERIAAALSARDMRDAAARRAMVRKRNTY